MITWVRFTVRIQVLAERDAAMITAMGSLYMGHLASLCRATVLNYNQACRVIPTMYACGMCLDYDLIRSMTVL